MCRESMMSDEIDDLYKENAKLKQGIKDIMTILEEREIMITIDLAKFEEDADDKAGAIKIYTNKGQACGSGTEVLGNKKIANLFTKNVISAKVKINLNTIAREVE